MCGICGEADFSKLRIRTESLQRMCDVLSHRGPDDEGMVFIKGDRHSETAHFRGLPSWLDGPEVGLGHRRLSIIDLSTAAHQPMSNEDGRIWIVFNGEIYNFQEIRERLVKKGHLFKSKSDTEVILHDYEECGVECLTHFRGMFAFAIWDSNLQRLFLARDRLGKKPLVYFQSDGHFAFASEIKALLQSPHVRKEVNDRAIDYYLTYQYVPSPDTIFEGIKKLPPAHYLLYHRDGSLRVERYWKLKFNAGVCNHIDVRGLEDRIRRELEESVKLRMISDVPLGAFLSGGVDSSLIVGIMAKLSGNPVKTFSIGFDEKEFDELSYARLVSRYFGTDHHEFIVKPNAVEILPRLVWHYNEPFADSSAIPSYYMAYLTKDFVKVVLTGDAGDENFAGYRRYLFGQWISLVRRVPEKMRKEVIPPCVRAVASLHLRESKLNRLADFLQRLTHDQEKNYLEQIRVFSAEERGSIYTEDFREEIKKIDSFDFLLSKFRSSETDDFLERLLYVDINSYLPEDLLVKLDIATMANSLEARVPFLDHQFMEFIATIPPRLKLRGTVAKYILKHAFKDFLPSLIFKRKKMGFAVPVSRWFRNELKNYVYELLLNSRLLNRGYFRKQGIERLLSDHMRSRYDHSAKIWALLFLEMWFRVFIDGEGDSFLHEAL